MAVTGNRPEERAGDLPTGTEATTDAAGPPGAPPGPDGRARARRKVPGLAALRRSVQAGRNDPRQVGLLAIPIGVVLVGGWIHRYVCDDAYITFRVVEQILHGHGPVFNAGERVEAVTSPMWLALLTAGEAIVGSSVELGWLAVIGGLVCTALAIGFAMAGAMALVPRYRDADAPDPVDDSVFAPPPSPDDSPARREQEAFWSKAAGPDPTRAAAPPRPGAGRAWPVGALVFVCTPPVWWYATSGLETGLTFLWLAVCFWGIARRVGAVGGERPRPDRPRWLLVVIGLGILVRPDLGIFALCFAVALALTSVRDLMVMVRAAAWMLAVPLAYQVFRMGYYASLVPNTALAKDAGAANWQRGLDYLDDFNGPYKMVIPLAVLAALIAFQCIGVVRRRGGGGRGANGPAGAVRSRRGRSVTVSSKVTSTVIASSSPARPSPPRPQPPGPPFPGRDPVGPKAALWVIAAPVVGALVYSLYVTRLGGDYMHARFLMPPLFALVLPVACVRFGSLPMPATSPDRRAAPPRGREWAVVGLVAVGCVGALVWSASMLVTQDYRQSNQDTNLARYKTVGARSDHPIVMDDYTFLALRGRALAKRQAAGEDVLVDESNTRNPTSALRPGQGVVAHMAGVGLESVAAGTEVWVVDRHGLADPLAARFAVKNGFDLPGHEKLMDYPYSQARFAPPDGADSSTVVAVRHALGCGQVAELYHATGDPLTFDRFVHNIIQAPALTQLRVPDDPAAMERQFCGP